MNGLKTVMVDGVPHVELPRNPVDEKIDLLSPTAIETLGRFDGREQTCTLEFDFLPLGVEALVRVGFLVHAGGRLDADGKQVSWELSRTFDGWNALERIKCGIYRHHKRIEEQRIARDLAEESHPLWGTF